MAAISNRLSTLVGTALILAFFSEFYFMNEGPVQLILAGKTREVLELVAYYLLFAYAFLICVAVFQVRSWVGLILAAGIYGLSAEAVVVPVVYEALPISLIWTSLSWHTLVDVVLGWGLLRLAMRAGSDLRAGLLFALLGALWAPWATWFWGATSPALTLAAFAGYTMVTSLGLGLGLFLADRAPVSHLRISRVEIILVALISVVFFGVTGLPFIPLPAVVVVMVGLILTALRVEQKVAKAGSILTNLDRPPRLGRYLTIALMPAMAILTYTLVLKTGFRIATPDVTLLFLTFGTLSFLWALASPVWRWARGFKKT